MRAELRIVERVGLPPDFPVAPGFPEGNYLKVAIAIRVPYRAGNVAVRRIAATSVAARLLGTVAAGLDLVEVLPDRALDVLVEVHLALGDLAQRR